MNRAGYANLLLLLIFSACVDPLARPTSRVGRPGAFASAPREEETDRSSRTSRGSRPPAVSYTTIAEILQRPTLFHKRWVRLKGRIAEARFSPARRGRSAVITVVYLSDRVGNTIEVAIAEEVSLRAGQEVTVEGRAMLVPTAPSGSADVVITAARVVTSLSDKEPAIVTTPKSTPPKAAPPKGATPRNSESSPEDEEGQIF